MHWGGTTENNHCGTHEFLDLCSQLSSDGSLCEPYICGNVGSGTVQEMAEWLEYITMGGQSPMADLRRRNGHEQPWPITYWAVGNENWGCGGNMRAEQYADEYRRFGSFCRNFSGQPLYKIACGHEDEWNETVMRLAGRSINGLSIHYYTVPGTWQHKGSATDFSTDEWFVTLQKAAAVDGFLKRTKAIMDRHDTTGRVGIILDEWGTWFDVEPGTNPGFLYQQNTMRDALVAALSFNIFHEHADRLHMANIAQTINVLQAMVLTDGPRMLLTPTYHVFDMFKVHQDATLLPAHLHSDDYTVGKDSMPQISASASRDASDRIHISLCNLHHAEAADITIDVRGTQVKGVSAQLLAGDAVNSMNTFDQPDTVRPMAFDNVRIDAGRVRLQLPPVSVAVLEVA